MGCEVVEVTCTYASNCYGGIEVDETCTPLREGDTFRLGDKTKLKLPIGKAEFAFPDGSVLRLTGPASLTLGCGDLKGMRGAFRWTVFLGKLWSMVSDRPLDVVDDTSHVNAVAGVRG